MLTNYRDFEFLGFMIHEPLSWDSHIGYIASKLSTLNGVLARLKHHLPFAVMKTIYEALFSSILQYGLSVWGGTKSKQYNRLVTLHKKQYATLLVLNITVILSLFLRK